MLKINEIFGPTIQGEGPSQGKEVLFLRLATCNLHCFRCDTPYTWFYEGSSAKHVDGVQFKKSKEIQEMSEWQVAAALKEIGGEKVKALVISGGEPLLQQTQLLPLIRSLKAIGWRIEVETNGTQVPLPEFIQLVDQINCSPKLESDFSGEPLKVRIREKALEVLAGSIKTSFKFVICDQGNINELLRLNQRFQFKDVYLMPEGRLNDEIQAKKPFILELCAKHGFKFSTRLHVELWGNKRGV